MKRVLATLLATLALGTAAPAGAAPADPDLVRLQALVRTAAVNPPGSELAAASLIAGWLQDAGIPAHVYTSATGRGSVIARLQAGAQPDPRGALMLLGHLDVVPVEAARWHHPPFAAEVVDGKLYGRGTLDMQDLVVMELHAFLDLAKHRELLKRDVIFCATADEEAGGDMGAGWLIQHHPDEVACAELLNEGGSGLVTEAGKTLMGIQVAERGSLWLRVTAAGRPGHGAQYRPDSAPRKLLLALARLEAQPRTYELGPETAPMLRTMGEAEAGTKKWLLQALGSPLLMPLLAPIAVDREPLLGPLLTMTVNPTVLSAGQKVNVVPAEASAEIDIRMLPGHSVAQTLAWVKRSLGDPDLKIEVTHASEPSRNDTSGRLYRALAEASKATYPGVLITPIMTPGGGTDSAWFRKLGVKCYGCAPILASAGQISSIHGDDEYITPQQLDAGARVVTDAVRRAATEN